MTEIRERATTEGGGRTPFFYLKMMGGFLFLLSLSGMICAGLLFNDIRSEQSRFLPETWQALLSAGGAPQGVHLALSVSFSLGSALLAAVIFGFAAVAEQMMRSR